MYTSGRPVRHAATDSSPGVPTGSGAPPPVWPLPTGTHLTPSARKTRTPAEVRGELPIWGEPVGVRQALVAVRPRQRLRNPPPIDRARAEGREQHASHVPALGSEHTRRRAVLRLEVMDEASHLGPR